MKQRPQVYETLKNSIVLNEFMLIVKIKNLSYLIFFLAYFFIGNGSCMLSYRETPFRCARGFPRDSSTRLGCERYCTSYKACIGYNYQTKVTVKNETHSCLLYTSNRYCPSKFTKNNGRVAKKSSELKPGIRDDSDIFGIFINIHPAEH